MTYIEREALIEDFDKIKDHDIDVDEAIERIANFPAADVVKVVRCRECKYYSFDNGAKWCVLHKGLAMVLPDAFCSYGEKRED